MNGYAVVIQDVRGRYSSEGEFSTFVNVYILIVNLMEKVLDFVQLSGESAKVISKFAGVDVQGSM